STQLIGVTPDISANSPYMYLPSGERESKNAMKWSEIDPVKYTVWPHKINYDEVIKNSKKRMQSNPYFTSIEEYARQLKQTRDNTAYSLNFDEFSNYMKDIEAKTNKMEELTKDTLNIEATIITPVAKTANDSVTIEQNNKWHKQLITDHVVVEALKICEDVKLN
ncbi:MAG: carboxy terminal-processing peptidase, partial [Bacteroidales bacterium]|nr:carboxy terminal-processing peptidase [Bacteroidales bacterium]